jgi:hypothetical protein
VDSQRARAIRSTAGTHNATIDQWPVIDRPVTTGTESNTMDERQIARGLGWLSIGLGLAEVAMPRKMANALGVAGGERLIRVFGLREIASGVMILSQNRRAPWLWARVAGDALDIGALGVAMRSSNRRGAVGAAIAGVAAITALDVICGGQLMREEA